MERPFKRQRLTDPPELDLLYRREQNDRRLKSTFEAIFEKYGRDFEGVGDEIDLETGEIVVNNGHVVGMINERDPGDLEEESEYESDDWSDSERILASSLLLETGRRFDALEYARLAQSSGYVDEEFPSEGDVDSLMGDNDSLVGDSELEPSPPPIQQAALPSDSLYDDATEDELASSDIEWPTPRKIWSTPRKMWPTPKTVAPLSHTPWHASPVKQVHKSKPPIDPIWKSPPLPTQHQLRKPAHPTSPSRQQAPMAIRPETPAQNLSIRDQEKEVILSPSISPPDPPEPPSRWQEALNIRPEIAPQDLSAQDLEEALPPPSASLHDPSKVLGNQKAKRAVNGDTRPKRVFKRGRLHQWSREEDSRLFRLRTTTKLKYAEILPHLPGRELHAIMVRWSVLMKRCEQGEIYDSLEPETVVAPSILGSPEKDQSYESDAVRDSTPSGLSAVIQTPEPTDIDNDGGGVKTSVWTNLDPLLVSSSPQSNKTPDCHELEIRNSGVSVDSQTIGSPPRDRRSRQQDVPLQPSWHVSTPGVMTESGQEHHVVQEPIDCATTESMPTVIPQPANVSKAQQTPSRSTSQSPSQSRFRSASRSSSKSVSQPISQSPFPLVSQLASQPGPQSTPQPPILRDDSLERKDLTGSHQPHMDKGSSSVSSTATQASDPQSLPPFTSRKPVFLPSYLSDESEDELSTPVKTVGAQQRKARHASGAMLSDLVLHRGGSTVPYG